ncbi:ABC transporter permease, partial [Kitasatospora sp. NPDC085879]
VTRLVNAYAQGAGDRVSTVDVVPLAHFDARGLAGFYMAFGVTLAGFVLGSNTLGLTPLLRLRHRFWLLLGTSAAIGTVGAIIAGPVLGAVPAPVLPLVFTLSLLAAAAAFTTKLLGTYLGPVGIPAATLLLLTVGNATSGATIGADLLPGAARAVSALLPPGAAVRAISDLSYFDGAHLARPVATLGLWAIIAALLVALHPRSTRRRTATTT